MRYCTECGQQLREGALFCQECGTPVKRVSDKLLNFPDDTSNQILNVNQSDQTKNVNPPSTEQPNQVPESNRPFSSEQSDQVTDIPPLISAEDSDQVTDPSQPSSLKPPVQETDVNPLFSADKINQDNEMNKLLLENEPNFDYQVPFDQTNEAQKGNAANPHFTNALHNLGEFLPQNHEMPSHTYNPNQQTDQTTNWQSQYPSRAERRQISSNNYHAPQPNPKQPMTKRKKIILLASISAIILLISAHFILQYLHSPQRIVEKFEQALKDFDAKKVANLLHTHNNVEIDVATVSGFLNYFEKNPDEINPLIKQLEAQVEQLENDGKESSDSMDWWNQGSSLWFEEEGFIRLEKRGKFLFYDQYQLMVPVTWVYLSTNYEDVTFSINGKEIGISDSEDYQGEFGPFIPGYHTVQATIKKEYINETLEEEIFLDGTLNQINLEMYFDLAYVEFSIPSEIDFEGAIMLYINGENTGVDLQENKKFGPITIDGSHTYYVEAFVDGKKVTTAEKPIEGRYIIPEFPLELYAFNKSEEVEQNAESSEKDGEDKAQLNLSMNESEEEVEQKSSASDESEEKAQQSSSTNKGNVETQQSASESAEEEVQQSSGFSIEEIHQFMESYFTAAVNAFNARDISYSRSYFDPSGPMLKEIEDYLDYIETTDFTEIFYWAEIVSVEETDGGYKVTTRENYDIFKGDGSGRNATFESQFTLSVVDGELKMHTMHDTEEINTIRF